MDVEQLTDFRLSGTLKEGTCPITVHYRDITETINITVLKLSDALTFELNEDGESYSLTGRTDQFLNADLVVPSEHLGKPVTAIGEDAFRDCEKLTSVTIGDNVTKIDKYAFISCEQLTSVTIGENVTEIGWDAFSGCINLTSVTFPDSLTYIGRGAFSYCSSLESITLPNNVGVIFNMAFMFCSSLRSITIPDSVVYVGSNAFSFCDSLEYNEYDNGLYLGNDNNPYLVLIWGKDKSITSCTINENTKFIHPSAFGNRSSLTSITIPDSVTDIGVYSFTNCSSLTSIIIGSNVTHIDAAFDNCTTLETVYYKGTADDWAKINIYNYSDSNNDLINATRYYYSETTPPLNSDGTAYDGNYWHMVGDTPTIWVKE